MEPLPFLLLWGLPQIWGNSEVQQRNPSLRFLQISSFANSSWTRTDGSMWLGALQTHTWSNDLDTIRFLKPWSQGKLSNQQWEKLQHIFRFYRRSFTRDVQEFAKMLHVDCELRDGILGSYPRGDIGCRSPTGRTWPNMMGFPTISTLF